MELSVVRRVSKLRLLLIVCSALPCAEAVSAQEADTAWNTSRVLELVERARVRRQLPLADTALRNYRAMANGYVYFYLDRQATDERTLVKTDQIALEVYWASPDRTKQRIVGLRDESRLPNRMRYHLDHLSVVQNGFGDIIRLGDGDEVSDVLHPAAPSSEAVYDFRLADSLTIRLPGTPDPVRVYEVKVRPKNPNESALVGSVFIDRAGGDIVRMTFTFTPASYVDRRLDYINISLDNIRWEGKYWLPFEQAVEIRRQIPELDFVAGAVIQGRFKVRDYEFNLDLPDQLFMGYRVVAVPEEERKSYPFETGLYDDLADAGLAPPPQMDDIRAEAARLMRQRFLSGLPRLRLHLRDASSVFRYGRAEGAFVGAGLSYAVTQDWRAELAFGHAFAAERATVIGGVRGPLTAAWSLRVEGYGNRVRDIGPRPGAAGAMNTLHALFGGEDYVDPYRAHGGEGMVRWDMTSQRSLELSARVERHSSAARVADQSPVGGEPFRDVRPIDEGTLVSATLSLRRTAVLGAGFTWSAGLSVEGGSLDPAADSLDRRGFMRPIADALLRWEDAALARRLTVDVAGGLAFGEPPAQRLFLLGGRNTIPGYEYRSFTGEAFFLAGAIAEQDIAGPWLRLRLLAGAGATGWIDESATDAFGSFAPASDSDGLRGYGGIGAGLFWNILRVDLVRGFDGGDWKAYISVDPRLWSIL